jgi:hypothetical protein
MQALQGIKVKLNQNQYFAFAEKLNIILSLFSTFELTLSCYHNLNCTYSKLNIFVKHPISFEHI